MTINHNSRLAAFVIFVVFLLIALDGCGFRLRGSGNAPVDLPATYIAGDGSSALVRDLRQSLKDSGTSVVEDVNQSELTITIKDERKDRRALTVSAQGKVQEYQLHYIAQFEVRDKAGGMLLAEQTVRAMRNYSYQDTAVLAKGGEEEQLYRDMRRDVIQGIMRRLQALNTSSETTQ